MSDCLKVVEQYMSSVKDGLLLQQCGFIEYEDFHKVYLNKKKGFLGCYAMAILSQIVWIKLGCIQPNLIVNECDILV